MTQTPAEQIADDPNSSLPLRILDDLIERMALSADAKALLSDLARITVHFGRVLIPIGRKILTLALEIVRSFPNTVFGIVVTVAVGLVLGSMGKIAVALGAVLTPLMLIFAVTKGMMADFAQANWASSLRDLERKLATVAP
ncbi:hypothetical protein [Neotabrizicola sp. VNH66]|uniref:hypothetical protein n=1 Tax=Neotabrizicola sp. VNH66 TaxID=3400918 RepID=UPI003C0002FC